MKNTIILGTFALISLQMVAFLNGCATDANKTLDIKTSQETVTGKASLQKEAAADIQSNPNLTSNQKTALDQLRITTRTKLDDLAEQSIKLRAVLIKDIVSTDYNSKEVSLIKKRLKKLENNRLNIMFEAVDQANKILGREAAQNAHIMSFYLDQGHGSRD